VTNKEEHKVMVMWIVKESDPVVMDFVADQDVVDCQTSTLDLGKSDQRQETQVTQKP
jgi:hypothetical protein